MSSPSRLTAFALTLSTASLLVAAYAVLSRAPAGEQATCRCDAESLQAELAALERRVDAAERTAMRGTVRRAADVATEPRRAPPDEDEPPAPDADPAPDEPAPTRRTTPRFVALEISEPGVSVTQADNGALRVHNTNAALVGQVVTVQARGEDGQLHALPITVPPVP